MFPPFGMMGMGMGMPMMPPMMPTPGVVPGVPGMGWYQSLPGRFGRDMLGRDFAGPGGVGSSQRYRPPDPSALPPMPSGLPFIARPGQEGFDAYGRLIPPDLPEGWDGWGRPIVAATHPNPVPVPAAQPPAPGPPGGPAAHPPPSGPPDTRDMPITSAASPSRIVSTSTATGRPEQPPCFDRQPAPQDSFFSYDEFEAFSLPSHALNHPFELHLPRELVSHDVSEEDWARFIDDLSKESITQATYDWTHRNRGVLGRGPRPVLTDSVHSLLLSWAVAFFAPRGMKIYAAADGRRIVPPPLDPGSTRRGFSAANEWSDDESETIEDDDSCYEEEGKARRTDLYLPRREREIRKDERMRLRRMERRRRREEMERSGAQSRAGWSGVGGNLTKGEWEVHFVCATPTLWTPGARPRTYGEPANRVWR